MADRDTPAIRRDWLSKTLAGLVGGGLLALGCSGLFAQANGAMPLSICGQLAMWMLPPIWLGVLGGVYFFRSGGRAWLVLGTAGGLVFGAFLILRSISTGN